MEIYKSIFPPKAKLTEKTLGDQTGKVCTFLNDSFERRNTNPQKGIHRDRVFGRHRC